MTMMKEDSALKALVQDCKAAHLNMVAIVRVITIMPSKAAIVRVRREAMASSVRVATVSSVHREAMASSVRRVAMVSSVREAMACSVHKVVMVSSVHRVAMASSVSRAAIILTMVVVSLHTANLTVDLLIRRVPVSVLPTMIRMPSIR